FGGHHRVRFGDGLLASRRLVQMEAFLQLATRDGRARGRQTGRGHRGAFAASGVRAPGLSSATPSPGAEPFESEKLIAETTPRQRRRNSRKAAIVAPPPQGFRLPKPIRRLQRRAPLYALQ